MARRPLPDALEAQRILATKRTRPARRPPPPAGRPLAPLLKALDARHRAGPHALKARWREIAGDVLARRTEPVRVTRPRGGTPGVLEVRVDGPAAALVQHQRPTSWRVNLVLGAEAVGRLRIVQGPVRPPAATAAPKPPRRRAQPLDAGAEAELAVSLADAPDGPLKRALAGLGRAVLRQGAR